MPNIQLRFYISSTLIGYKPTIFNALKKLTEMDWMLKKKPLFDPKRVTSRDPYQSIDLIKYYKSYNKHKELWRGRQALEGAKVNFSWYLAKPRYQRTVMTWAQRPTVPRPFLHWQQYSKIESIPVFDLSTKIYRKYKVLFRKREWIHPRTKRWSSTCIGVDESPRDSVCLHTWISKSTSSLTCSA